MTVAGLVIERTGRLPTLGKHVDVGGWRIWVLDLDGRRVDTLLGRRLPPAS